MLKHYLLKPIKSMFEHVGKLKSFIKDYVTNSSQKLGLTISGKIYLLFMYVSHIT